MDERLLEAALSGNSSELNNLVLQDPGILLGTTPQGSTCLHISSMFGHEVFSMAALAVNQALLSSVNSNGETPLMVAITCGQVSIASALLKLYQQFNLHEIILKQDNNGNNALHNAIHYGHSELALELITAEPRLSQVVNRYNESALFIAVTRCSNDVFQRLLEIPSSSHAGPNGLNALHAALRTANPSIAKTIVEARPSLAREGDKMGATPMHLAVVWNKLDVVRILLDHDRSLGYVIDRVENCPLLCSAAFRGNVAIAEEILKCCPDAGYSTPNGWTMLHSAVEAGNEEFVEFILRTPQLHKLINMRDKDGDTALHNAVRNCNPKIVRALLSHRATDITILNNIGGTPSLPLIWTAVWAKTLKWVRR